MYHFFHHPDNIIYLENTYREDLVGFLLDVTSQGLSYSGLPEGYRERCYTKNVCHFLKTSSTAYPQNLIWELGDTLYTNKDNLNSKRLARNTSSFLHDENDIITINYNGKTYKDTLNNFKSRINSRQYPSTEIVLGVPIPVNKNFPDYTNTLKKLYCPGVCHWDSNGALSLAWANGDIYIENIEEII